MRRVGFAIAGIFLLKEEFSGSIFLHTAVAVVCGFGKSVVAWGEKRQKKDDKTN